MLPDISFKKKVEKNLLNQKKGGGRKKKPSKNNESGGRVVGSMKATILGGQNRKNHRPGRGITPRLRMKMNLNTSWAPPNEKKIPSGQGPAKGSVGVKCVKQTSKERAHRRRFKKKNPAKR